MSEVKPLAESMADLAAPFSRLLASMTDEQWAEHDARIAGQKAELEGSLGAAKQVERRKRLLEAGFPRRALEAAEAANEKAAALVRVMAWDPTDRSVLVLSGPPGCGKTVAATWWAMQRDWAPAFVRATTFAASSRYDRDSRDAWLRAGALVLDDLGTEYADAKGSFLTDLDELIDTFHGDRRPLVITTNLKADDFRERYGARIVDRVRESGRWESVAGASLRGRR